MGARRCNGSGHCGNFSSAQRLQNKQRIMQTVSMASQARLHNGAFFGQTRIIHTRAAPNPILNRATKQSRRDCRSWRCIADAHFAGHK